MAAQKGFEYDRNVVNYLKKVKLVHPSFQPASATSDRADLELYYKRRKVNIELKIEAASGGSLVLKWDGSASRSKRWGFGDVSDNDEKQFLAELAESSGALKEINKRWTDTPLKRGDMTPEERAAIANIEKRQRYRIDQAKFPEINGILPGRVVADYYAMKNTHYINVGTNGFYLLGSKDPEKLLDNCKKYKLPPIPSFAKSANVKYRARVQDKGGGNYQYTFELSFTLSKSASSPYNIGPCRGGGNVSILKEKVNISCFV